MNWKLSFGAGSEALRLCFAADHTSFITVYYFGAAPFLIAGMKYYLTHERPNTACMTYRSSLILCRSFAHNVFGLARTTNQSHETWLVARPQPAIARICFIPWFGLRYDPSIDCWRCCWTICLLGDLASSRFLFWKPWEPWSGPPTRNTSTMIGPRQRGQQRRARLPRRRRGRHHEKDQGPRLQ
jgi:hypothetical protein